MDELLLLEGRERRADGFHEHVVELVAREPFVRGLVEMAYRPGAELGVLLRLEVLIGEPPVLGELVLIWKVVAVGDREPRPGVDVDAHPPLVRDAERAPA